MLALSLSLSWCLVLHCRPPCFAGHLDAYHSRGAMDPSVFFEGVYYKFVGPYSDDIIVVIPVSAGDWAARWIWRSDVW